MRNCPGEYSVQYVVVVVHVLLEDTTTIPEIPVANYSRCDTEGGNMGSFPSTQQTKFPLHPPKNHVMPETITT